MVCPVIKAATTCAKDPQVITGAGVVIMSTFKLWEDITKYPKEKEELDPDLDWLNNNDVLR